MERHREPKSQLFLSTFYDFEFSDIRKALKICMAMFLWIGNIHMSKTLRVGSLARTLYNDAYSAKNGAAILVFKFSLEA